MKKALLIFLFITIQASPLYAGSISLNTYYPAPFGAYDRLRLVPRAAALACNASLEGLMYYDDALNAIILCREVSVGVWAWSSMSGVWTEDSVNNYVYLTNISTNPNLNVGIGTLTPQEQLEITENFRLPPTTLPGGSPVGVIYSSALRLLHTYGTKNTFLGESAGNFTTTAQGLTAIGEGSMLNIAGGWNNTAVGAESMGFLNANALPFESVAVGTRALRSVTSGTHNTGIGFAALSGLTTGNTNIAIGRSSMASANGRTNVAIGAQTLLSTTGSQNTTVGTFAMEDVTSGSNNTGMGYRSLHSTTTGSSNTAVGYEAGSSNLGGSNNVFIGTNAGQNITGQSSNTFVGSNAGVSSTAGGNNTFVGDNTGLFNTGADNTYIGHAAGNSNTSGSDNTFVGSSSGVQNQTGIWNTFVGKTAGFNNNSGDANTFIGNQAGSSNVLGVANTFVGQRAGQSNTGSHNTFIGHYAGNVNGTGERNISVGSFAGRYNVSGTNNVSVGYYAGLNALGSSNVFLGYSAVSDETGSNKLYIHNNSSPLPLIYGDFSTGRIGLGTNNPAAYLHITRSGDKQLMLGHDNQPNLEWLFSIDGAAKMSVQNENNGTLKTVLKLDPNTSGQVEISSVMKLTPIASAPACSAIGMLYVDTSDALCYCGGAGWIKIAGPGFCI